MSKTKNDQAFDNWWTEALGDHMKGSRYLAKRAWDAAMAYKEYRRKMKPSRIFIGEGNEELP